MADGFPGRLAVALEASGVSQSELARRLGTVPSVVGDLLSGRSSKPGKPKVTSIARETGAQFDWLAWGTGEHGISLAGASSRRRAAPDAARCAEVLVRLRAAVDELAALMEDDGQGEEHGRAAGGPR